MLVKEERILEVLKDMELTRESIDERVFLSGITGADLAAIKASKPSQSAIDGIVDEFHNKIAAQKKNPPPLPQGFDESRLKNYLHRYLTELHGGKYDLTYARSRVKIGLLCHELGIERAWFAASYGLLLDQLLRLVFDDSAGKTTDPNQLGRALIKVAILDLALIQEARYHADCRAFETIGTDDPVTGLSNYSHLLSKFSKRLAQKPKNATVFFVGLNRFKAINETLGHSTGNQILIEVATRLGGAIRDDGLISRLGGDIFVIALFDACKDEDQCNIIAEDIHHSITQPFEQDNFAVDLTVSVGVARSEGRIPPAEAMMQQAEMALYSAKKHQLPTTVFTSEMKQYSLAQLSLGTELMRAIENDELVLFYQPKIDALSGEPIGVEALIRWIHPIKGFMSPALFIPHAEQTILIHPVTDWVLKTAIAQLSIWRKAGIDLVMSVNLAAANLQNIHLPSGIEELLKQHRVPPGKLMLEITESGLMADPARGKETLNKFQNLGIQLSIDDFGTGYSSLAYLKTLPVDEVKIDRTFVFGMEKDNKDDRIVRATIKLAHSLGLKTTAEGVENQEVVDKLKVYGCDTLQGFFFAKPQPADELETWMSKYKPVSRVPKDVIEK